MVKISNLDLGKVKPVCPFGISKKTLKLFRMGLFLEAYVGRRGWEGKKTLHSQKSVTHPTMKKHGIVIPYLKKIQKIHKSRDTPLEYC